MGLRITLLIIQYVGLWELCSKFPSLFYSEFLLEIHRYAHFYSFYASDFINIPKYFLTF